MLETGWTHEQYMQQPCDLIDELAILFEKRSAQQRKDAKKHGK